MNNLRKIIGFLIFIVSAQLLLACRLINNYSQTPGVIYVAALGNPHATTLIWSPIDEAKILVSANDLMSHKSKVYIIDIQTKKKTTLVDASYGDVWGTAWLPSTKQVALSVFSATEGISDAGVWLINPEDNSKERFLDKPVNAVWLPNGKSLVFQTGDITSSLSPKPAAIALMDIQTKTSEVIYSSRKAEVFTDGFSLSPNGQYLVFSLVSDLNSFGSDIYILNLQTRSVVQLTNDKISSSPQWSPKGDLIVYVKGDKAGNKITPKLHITVPDGSCDVEIPKMDYALSPTWSPDGRKIAFISKDGIYVLDVDKVFGRDIYKNLCS